jgi:hypothetical protein
LNGKSWPKYLSIRVNSVINSRPGKQERKDYGLLDMIKRESVLQLAVGKQKKQDEGHIHNTTWNNIDSWFDGAKKMMLDLEFARKCTPGETEHDGEVYIDENNCWWIVNLGEYNTSLDGASGHTGMSIIHHLECTKVMNRGVP